MQHPVRAFLRRRLGVGGSAGPKTLDDALSVELDALERWSVGERLLEARLAGADKDAAIAAEIARGELPPDLLAEPVLADVVSDRRAARRSGGGLRSGSRTRAPRSTCGWSSRTVAR